MIGHNGGPRLLVSDAQSLAFVQAQAYRINSTIYEEMFPEWDFERFVFVDTTGPAWSPGVLTYSSTMSGRAEWQSGYAKDVPLADVGQDATLKTHHLAAIGYQYNIEEINTAIQVGGSLPDRRARAARLAYREFMWNVTMYGLGYTGAVAKGMGGLTNYPGVVATAAPANGDSAPTTAWVLNNGTGNKTPAEIIADINFALSAVNSATRRRVLADTLLLPQAAYDYIAGTPFSATSDDTILSWVMRTNVYTIETGRPLTIRVLQGLERASTQTVVGGGRMVAYANSPNYVRLHLPMPHQFLPVYQDGPLNFAVPGIFRTGGLEVVAPETVRYLDGITPIPA